jgi:activator of HSP90 ATPase
MNQERGSFAWQFGRRQMLLRSAMAAGGAAMFAARTLAAESEISRTAEAIHQEVRFQAAPERVYDALTDAAHFQKVEALSDAMKSMDMSTHPVVIEASQGGAFSLFGGYIAGRQIELASDERIVQAWRVMSWDPGIYSIARFELVADGSATKLVFDHTGFPAGMAEHLASGWHANYWDPLAKFLRPA